MTSRPSFIVSARDIPERTHVYPQSTEQMGPNRRVGKAAGQLGPHDGLPDKMRSQGTARGGKR
jgi:hypothetical protein